MVAVKTQPKFTATLSGVPQGQNRVLDPDLVDIVFLELGERGEGEKVTNLRGRLESSYWSTISLYNSLLMAITSQQPL